MAYRRTYRDLEAPWGGELDFNLEFTDGEIYQAVEAILEQEDRSYEMRKKLKYLGASLSGQDRETWKWKLPWWKICLGEKSKRSTEMPVRE